MSRHMAHPGGDGDHPVLALRVQRTILDRLDAKAKAIGLSRQQFVRLLLNHAVEQELPQSIADAVATLGVAFGR